MTLSPQSPVLSNRMRPPSRELRRILDRVIWPVLGILVAIGIWAILARMIGSSAVLPGPVEVASNLVENFNGAPALAYLGLSVTSYAGNLAATASSVLSGWFVGGALGLTVGLLSARIQWIRNVIEPITTVFGVVPILVAAPFALVWFGTGWIGKFLLIAFFTAVTVSVVAQSAASVLPPRYEEYAATLGASKSGTLRRVVFPATARANLTGLRAALGQAWGLQVVAELLGASSGIGRAIAVRAGTGDVAAVLALIIALGIVAVICDAILALLVRRLTQWQTETETKQ